MIVIGATGVIPIGNPQPTLNDPSLQNFFFALGLIFVLLGPLFVLRELPTKIKPADARETQSEITSENVNKSSTLLESGITNNYNLLTGKWEQIIYKGLSQEIEKRDVIECKQSGEVVEAEIFRVFPEEQKGREWHFSGRFRNHKLFGHFWSDAKDAVNALSFGTIYLVEDKKNLLTGNYVRAHKYKQSWVTDKLTVQTIRLQWQRIK